MKFPVKLAIFSIVLLLFLPSVAAVYRIKDASRTVLCRDIPAPDIMRGEDEPGKPRIFLIPGDTVDINRASERELALLPHVGELIAGRIVSYRQENGGFTDVRQLLEIDGIGEAGFEDMLAYIYAGELK